MTEPIYLNTVEAAHMLGVSRGYLNQLRVYGGGPSYVKLSRKTVRYAKAELVRWAESRSRTATYQDVKASA